VSLPTEPVNDRTEAWEGEDRTLVLPAGDYFTRGFTSLRAPVHLGEDAAKAKEHQAKRHSADDLSNATNPSSDMTLPEAGRAIKDRPVLRKFSWNEHSIVLPATLRYANLLELSICYFFAAGTLPVFQSIGPEVKTGEFIKKLYTASPDPCLRQAIKAAALVNYANRFRPERCESLLFTEYGRAIKSLKCALEDPVQSRKNESLLAALMIALYEVSRRVRKGEIPAKLYLQFYVAINPSWTIKNWNHHGEGVRALIRVRGKEMLSTSTGRWLFVLVQLGCVSDTRRCSRKIVLTAHRIGSLFCRGARQQTICSMRSRIRSAQNRPIGHLHSELAHAFDVISTK